MSGTVGIPGLQAGEDVKFLASAVSVAINGEVIAAGGGTRGAIHY